LVLASKTPLLIFYDLDMPLTLERLKAGESVDYIGPRRLADFDLVLSFTGGRALFADAREWLGAEKVIPLYGGVDPDVHRPVEIAECYRGALSYLGTYAADRHAQVDALLFEPAKRMKDERFILAGPLYPDQQRGGPNVHYFPHVAPSAHSCFYRSSDLTLSVARCAMKRYGYCPSARLFESAASGAAIVTESFDGLSDFFELGQEVLVADTTEEILDAIQRVRAGDGRFGEKARRRAIEHHSADARAAELESILDRGEAS
jgi:spore maturation protein CgeB